jgi:hypothetical protein
MNNLLKLLCVCCFLSSCCSSGVEGISKNWNFGIIERNLTEVAKENADETNIERFRSLYKLNPHRIGYEELEFEKLLLDKSNNDKYYTFNVLYVEDLGVAYVVNADGELVRSFMYSLWDIYRK